MIEMMLKPEPRDVYSECGTLAGRAYAHKALVYYRRSNGLINRVIVLNGMIVEWTEEFNGKIKSIPECTGEWAWGAHLAEAGFRIIRRWSAAEYLRMVGA